jgi:hypothetical protein
MKFNTIYSLGSRCQNSEVLKHYGYREFSGFFDFMNTDNVENIKHILADDFNEILKDDNNYSLVCNQTTFDPETGVPLHSSIRTSNKFYNKDYTDVHSAIFPHHDLNSDKDKRHFLQCKERFKKLVKYNVLFNYTYNSWENPITVKDMEFIVETLKKTHGFKNFKVCFIRVSIGDESKINQNSDTEFFSDWDLYITRGSFTGGLFGNPIDNKNYIDIILNHGIDEIRITKEKIDK